jgi:hypothetical protein
VDAPYIISTAVADMSPSARGRKDPNNVDTARSNEEQPSNSRTPLLKSDDKQQSSFSGKISNLLQDWWLWELFALGTSLLSITIITVILFLYDSSSLPDWPSVFTVRFFPFSLHCALSKSRLDQFRYFFLWYHRKVIVRVSYSRRY